MKASALNSALSLSGALAAIGSYCKDSKGNYGTCQKVNKCKSLNGYTKTDLCPNDPDDVKCCFYPDCNSNGFCQRDSLSCSGTYFTGDCSGSTTYRCCNLRTGKPPICSRDEKTRRCIPL
ncbi:uncharacterized protein GLRG_06294 [Colletotrichum graminicola M1.001]|uniref:Secreted protein n=1 Tax=Colletotrichum graminicola (strain M1.001 / M2 / FGSC 10212) TaxID=645133 RepID=E3QJW2_COLGM|nr:uncharacterized protein GLRG_06294 [Colletotrichum graminicola M1.001]EFQ31150.1 hypothetical protein GLRG_06294 [Colletotrichum graminicola M1.001]